VARLLGLPYFDARMSVEPKEDLVTYRSVRTHRNATAAELQAVYAPAGPVYYSAPGSLDRWLTARYCLYGAHGNRIVHGEIDHPPWPLQAAEIDLRVNTMTQPLGIALADNKPIAHFARRLDVVAWPVVRLKNT